jgi:ribosome biogenesis GTPase
MTSSAPPRSTPCLTSELTSDPAKQGLITAAYGRRFLVECADGRVRDCVTRGKRTDYACGDQVTVTDQNDDQGVIDSCGPRKTLLYRSDRWKQKLIAANVTQMIMVVAPVPSFDLDVLDCCLAAAEHAGIRPLIVLNKSDLAESATSAAALTLYTGMGYPLLKLAATEGVDELRPHLSGQRSVLVGESGMGKSTILNQLVPNAAALTREVSASLGTGKHTTSHARLHHLDASSDIIDTPGVQSFGLHHLGVIDLAAAFIEFRPFLGRCRFRDCRHLEEPGCAILAAHEAEQIDTRRLAVYCRLAAENLRQQKQY